MVFCKILTKKQVYINRCDKGFTLIELMVALAAISVLTTLIYPQFNSFQNTLALKQAANQLASDIRYTKQKSIASENGVLRSIRVSTKDIDITKGTPNSYIVKFGTVTEKQVDFNKLYDGRVTIESSNFADNLISFNYVGYTSGGTVTLQSKDGKQLFVIVSMIMGRVRIDTKNSTSGE